MMPAEICGMLGERIKTCANLFGCQTCGTSTWVCVCVIISEYYRGCVCVRARVNQLALLGCVHHLSVQMSALDHKGPKRCKQVNKTT